jgi:hypothetical protein
MRLRGMGDGSRALPDTESILPVQFFPSSRPQTPYLRLLTALTENAIEQLETTNYMRDIRAVRRWNETVEWFQSDAEDWGTFVFCCHHIGGEVDSVRKALGKRYPLTIRPLPPLRHTNAHRAVIDRSPVSYPDATIKCFQKKRYYVVFADGSACWVLRHNCTDENTIWNAGEKGTLVVTWRASRAISHYARPATDIKASVSE